MSLEELFPEGDYRFHLTLRRAEPSSFFGPQDASGQLLAERARWLAADGDRYAAIRPEGEPLLREVAQHAAAWGATRGIGELMDSAPTEAMRVLGCTFEPDILLLSADAEGRFRLRGGALCFPTGWALEDKIGHPLDFIHDVVPGLNQSLSASIHQFLSRLKPGAAFLRDNWGVAASDELNLHPARHIPAPQPPADLQRLWLRVEHQALVALPETKAIVFGIRIALHRLDAVAGTAAARGFRRALETMPANLVAYKRLDAIREHLLNVL
jgi:dimethylamine monooxygenase subunit A